MDLRRPPEAADRVLTAPVGAYGWSADRRERAWIVWAPEQDPRSVFRSSSGGTRAAIYRIVAAAATAGFLVELAWVVLAFPDGFWAAVGHLLLAVVIGLVLFAALGVALGGLGSCDSWPWLAEIGPSVAVREVDLSQGQAAVATRMVDHLRHLDELTADPMVRTALQSSGQLEHWHGLVWGVLARCLSNPTLDPRAVGLIDAVEGLAGTIHRFLSHGREVAWEMNGLEVRREARALTEQADIFLSELPTVRIDLSDMDRWRSAG